MARKFVCSPTEPIVTTAEGKLRGFILDGIYTFHGIKYADAKRFQMPTAVKPWDGVKDATNYGYICPTGSNPAPTGEMYIPHRFWPANEHCQYLNIWTTSIDTEAKKPVMVWLHGGGYSSGSSMEQVAYEGDALAQFGDVVVVTINHRLNILGHLDMSFFGEKYYNSKNVGIADIVEALRWVNRNIAAFGGDAGNVTVFGQSGGGGKVQTLLQTPAAAGLFHKGILMSGIFESPRDDNTDAHRLLVEYMLEELKIPVSEVERLEAVPMELLYMVYNKAHLRLMKQGKFINWGPSANDWYLGDPMHVGFTDYAKTVPTMAGTVIAEWSEGAKIPDGKVLSDSEKYDLVKKLFGDDTDEILELYKKAYPDKDVTRLEKMDVLTRLATTRFIERKAQESEAPAYLYLFALDFDVNGQRPAWHCSDIPYIFHNSHRVPCCNMEGVTETIEKEMAGAWVNFARTGNPNHADLANWPAYTDETKATMVFDRVSQSRINYDRALVEKLKPHVFSPFDMASRLEKAIARAEANGEGADWLY